MRRKKDVKSGSCGLSCGDRRVRDTCTRIAPGGLFWLWGCLLESFVLAVFAFVVPEFFFFFVPNKEQDIVFVRLNYITVEFRLNYG